MLRLSVIILTLLANVGIASAQVPTKEKDPVEAIESFKMQLETLMSLDTLPDDLRMKVVNDCFRNVEKSLTPEEKADTSELELWNPASVVREIGFYVGQYGQRRLTLDELYMVTNNLLLAHYSSVYTPVSAGLFNAGILENLKRTRKALAEGGSERGGRN